MDEPENIKRIANIFISDLTIRRLNTDAINGYGLRRSYIVTFSIADSRCVSCGKWAIKMPLSEQMNPSNRACHQWKVASLVVGEATAATYDEALSSVEDQCKAFADSLNL